MTTTDGIASYAAVVATLVASFEIYKYYRDRLKIDVQYYFRPDEEVIYLINGSKESVIITHYRFIWAKEWMGDLQEVDEINDIDFPDLGRVVKLPAGAIQKLKYHEMFRLPTRGPDGTDMYIELTIAGRSSKVVKRITDWQDFN